MNKKYELIERIGAGCFGSIYRGRNIRTSEQVAIKVESINSETMLLKNESVIYQYLKDCSGIPKVKWFGKDDQNYYMVIELLGQSLEQLKVERGTLTLQLTIQIGQQILSILQSIHDLGLVHRDIKPDNFLLHLRSFKTPPSWAVMSDEDDADCAFSMRKGVKSKQLFMIDFGFCKKYSISDNPKTTTSLIGSPNYASINAHNCVELSRRDDLESLGYMLIYLHLGKLPWSTDIIKSKMQYEPTVFADYLRYVRALEFNETPDYNVLGSLIRDK